MVSLRSLLRLASGLLLALILGSALALPTTAQDRSVPRFGPLVAPDSVEAAPTDLGRLWSLAQPPLEYFEDTYDVRADERGLRHLRLGTVRLPDCSGALVSPRGLLLTAAQCVRSFLPGDSLQSGAFVASEQDEERRLSGLHVERVVGIEIVTDVVAQEGQEAVQARLQDEAGSKERVEVVAEAGGTRHVAYTYRRHEDVRLAFYPDPAVTLLGRLGELLTYPQHAWDLAVLRVYTSDDGQTKPLRTPDHLSVRRSGARPGDAVFAVGYPAETRRVETHHQLSLRRDLQLPAQVSAVEAWADALRRYADSSAQSGEWRNRLADARTTHTRLQAQLNGLRSDYVMNHLRARDRALQRVLQADTARDGETHIDRLAVLQEEKRAYAQTYRAFSFLLHSQYSSATLLRAVRVAQARAAGEGSSSALQETLGAIPDQPVALDAARMAEHFARVQQFLETDTALTRRLEQAGPPDSLVQTSVFSNAKTLQTRLRENTLPEDDPMLRLGEALADRYSDMRNDWTALAQREAPLTDSLAQIRHQVDDRPVALPQDRALRMADGRIRGYPYNGTVAPPFTTFYGLYERHHALSSNEDELPAPWQSPDDTFERSTPLTTVTSTDLGGGAYGGPVVNRSLELVGVAVDGNVQSAAGEYLFLPERMRTVAVDVRGAVEGLSSVYGAERLVQEMIKDAPTQ